MYTHMYASAEVRDRAAPKRRGAPGVAVGPAPKFRDSHK